MKQRSKFWPGRVTLGATALLLAWTWRFTLPAKASETLSKAHFQKHFAQLEALHILLQEDGRQSGVDVIITQAVAETEAKNPLPEERAARYRSLMLDAHVDCIVCSEEGSRIGMDNFNQTTEYAFFPNGPTRYDWQHGSCEILQGHWHLYHPH